MNEVILIVAVAAVLLAIGAAVYLMQRQRSRALRSHFGPEYDRVLDGHGERRAAERALLDRARRVDKLAIHPLAPARRDELWNRWQAVQSQFVDDPALAIQEAHLLLANVMREQGYPTGRFDDETELLSVHHPATVQHYREAHRLATEREHSRNTTEDLRQALIHYRALFEDLLHLGITNAPGHTQGPTRKEVRHEA